MVTGMSGLKISVQRILDRAGLHSRLKSSVIYDLYWAIMDPAILRTRSEEVEFYRSVLKGLEPGDLILDVGANQGYKTDMFLRLGARVVAVDPDEDNQRVLEERFCRYRAVPRPVVIEPVAVSDAIAVEKMWVEAPGSAKNTLSSKWVDTLREDQSRFGESVAFRGSKVVATTTLTQLMEKHGTPFFIKIDVEGFEPKVLAGLRQAVPYVSFEVNLPEFEPEGKECLRLLQALDPHSLFNYTANPRSGLALAEWLRHDPFIAAFDGVHARSVDVFCRSDAARTGT